MQLKEIHIKDLFGHFDHVIELNTQDNITIITGVNGYGKTTILNCIDAIFNSKFDFFFQLQFSELKLIFNTTKLTLQKLSDEQCELILFKSNDKQEQFEALSFMLNNDNSSDERRYNRISETVPNLDRISPDNWYDHRLGRRLRIDDIKRIYPQVIDFLGNTSFSIPLWLQEFIKTTRIHLIKDQRLLTRKEKTFGLISRTEANQTVDTIQEYAVELKVSLYNCRRKYDTLAAEQDASLPTRLLKPSKSETGEKQLTQLKPEQLKLDIKELKSYYQKLNSFGILSEIEPFDFESEEIQPEDRKFLSLYISDHKDKLTIYRPILEQIELFTDILNHKGLAFKKIKVNPDDGFTLLTDDNQDIILNQLSSGEQHQIILLYELIFKAKANDLVLIDEPEISLHIIWQEDFIKDIRRITEKRDVTVIVATHSPQIIDVHWDWTVDLEGSKIDKK